jgi:hypothetical protein
MDIEQYFDSQKKIGWKKTHQYVVEQTPDVFLRHRCKGDLSDFPGGLEFICYSEPLYRRVLIPVFRKVSL